MNATLEASQRDARQPDLPDSDTLFQAFLSRDPAYDGSFVTAVRTTGIFCRPTCRARKPKRENVEFFVSSHAAILAGYRPCKQCRPLAAVGEQPEWVRSILDDIHRDPSARMNDADLSARGVGPARIRRWFKANTGLTFHGYHRALRVGRALGDVASGRQAIEAAYDSGYESLSGFSSAVKRTIGKPTTRGAETEPILLTRIPTPLGPMVAGADTNTLFLLEFVDRRAIETQLHRLRSRLGAEMVPGHTPVHDLTRDQLAEYFAGSRRSFDLTLELPGTDFQRQVWRALMEIPYGETRTYGEQAQAIGKPEAIRAVARANGDNRLAIVVPCHRVIGADGHLTGYGGGLMRKRRLLDLEAGLIRW